jgi:uncharacterized protein
MNSLNDLTVLFISIVLESLPFVLLGACIASLIGMFISDDLLYRLIPRNPLLGFIAVSLLGLLFPVCDCTIIPVMRRLIRKGLPASLAVTFMCAVPIVNPSVIASTWWAFSTQPSMTALRIIIGLCTAITVGYLTGRLTNNANPLKSAELATNNSSHEHTCGCNHNHSNEHTCSCNHNHDQHDNNSHHPVVPGCNCSQDHNHSPQNNPVKKKTSLLLKRTGHFLNHTTSDFLDSMGLIILGALLSASVQMLIPRTIMFPLAHSDAGSVGAMMAFTWSISLCANADAFVAKSFNGLFTTGSILIFMVFGQMTDLKNTIVMLGFFKKRFVLLTITLLAVLCFLWGFGINLAGGIR